MSNFDNETDFSQAGMSRRNLLQAAGAGALAVSALAIAGCQLQRRKEPP
ncbi:hypothetical protein N8A98_11930 [Devosia neptuniae]|uniref:Uncharacterized protein n=1 Tax=Devosia neptuniae TaxID=191302 RepID=A0ABY6CI01_9HYPH|nr:hypothetical protein [Devosia neptuniae]UXN71835.1 hypothetical protein N8A98_11930 [Devosia neptuniae]